MSAFPGSASLHNVNYQAINTLKHGFSRAKLGDIVTVSKVNDIHEYERI